MIKLEPRFRHAMPDDARILAEFVNMAGEGMPLYVWQGMAKAGESPWEIGCARACRDSGSFSYRNAIVRVLGDECVACLIGYPLEDAPAPANYSDMPPMFVPLQQLEELVPGTWYINVVATRPEHRGKGYGTELLELAESICVDAGKRGLSLIVADTNAGARRLYRAHGFREIALRPMVKERWAGPGAEWVLMLQEITRQIPEPAPEVRRT